MLVFNNIFEIRSLSRNKKMLVIWVVDLILALLCWIIFGPALSVLVATNFDIKLLDILVLNYLNFIIPFLFTSIYIFIYQGFIDPQ